MIASSSDEGPVCPDDAHEVARVVDAWGVKGWIKVEAFSADPQALFGTRRWFVRPPDLPTIRPGDPARRYPPALKIHQVRAHGEYLVAQVEGVDDRTQAEALRGARLFVPRSSFPSAGEDEFYWVDLIGLEVFNRAEESLGMVAGLLDTGPHSVLRVLPRDAQSPTQERLIPFVAAYVDDVDLKARRIKVDWGLDY